MPQGDLIEIDLPSHFIFYEQTVEKQFRLRVIDTI